MQQQNDANDLDAQVRRATREAAEGIVARLEGADGIDERQRANILEILSGAVNAQVASMVATHAYDTLRHPQVEAAAATLRNAVSVGLREDARTLEMIDFLEAVLQGTLFSAAVVAIALSGGYDMDEMIEGLRQLGVVGEGGHDHLTSLAEKAGVPVALGEEEIADAIRDSRQAARAKLLEHIETCPNCSKLERRERALASVDALYPPDGAAPDSGEIAPTSDLSEAVAEGRQVVQGGASAADPDN